MADNTWVGNAQSYAFGRPSLLFNKHWQAYAAEWTVQLFTWPEQHNSGVFSYRIRISSNHSHCADSLSVNSNLNPRTILSCGQVVQQSLDASAGADKEMTLTQAQKEVLRLLQVADNFFSASGGNKTSSAGTSRTRSMTLYMGLFLVSSSELLCTAHTSRPVEGSAWHYELS